MKIAGKILNVIVDILIVLLLLISAAVAIIAVSSKSAPVPNLFGYAPLSVQTDSMSPEFDPGDLIISQVTDENTEYAAGDVITFAEQVNGTDIYNSHRIVDIKETEGVTLYYTKGDNSPAADENPVISANIVAKYSGICIKGMGAVYDFLNSQLGFFLVILLPLILFFLYEVFRVIRNLIDYNKEKALTEAAQAAASVSAESSGLTEEELKEALQNYLDKQKNEKTAALSQNDSSGGET